MKKNFLWVIIVLLCIALFVCAYLLYDRLKDDYAPTNLAPVQTEGTTVEPASEQIEVPVETAPDFTAEDADGNSVKLSDYFGKPIVLNLWASWCPPCKAEMPDFEEAYKKYGDDVAFVMLNLTDGYRETKAKADAHVASCGYTFPVYYDTAMKGAIAYKVSAVPQTCFINARGQLVSTSVGMMDGATLEGWIERLLKV